MPRAKTPLGQKLTHADAVLMVLKKGIHDAERGKVKKQLNEKHRLLYQLNKYIYAMYT